MQRNLIVDMELSLYNRSRANSSVKNLFSVVQSGALDTIPVQRGSLVIEGLPKVSRRKNLDLNPTVTFTAVGHKNQVVKRLPYP